MFANGTQSVCNIATNTSPDAMEICRGGFSDSLPHRTKRTAGNRVRYPLRLLDFLHLNPTRTMSDNLTTTNQLYPVTNLTIRARHLGCHLELRYPSTEDAVALGWLREAGVVDPGQERRLPRLLTGLPDTPEGRVRAMVSYHWRLKADLSPGDWKLPLCVVVDGVVCGGQTVSATGFAEERLIESRSWLGKAHQGKGYGTWARAAMLELAFIHLKANYARTGWLSDNTASERVSLGLGYTLDGMESDTLHKVPSHLDYTLLYATHTRHRWAMWRPDWCDNLRFSGVEACLPFLGAD